MWLEKKQTSMLTLLNLMIINIKEIVGAAEQLDFIFLSNYSPTHLEGCSHPLLLEIPRLLADSYFLFHRT